MFEGNLDAGESARFSWRFRLSGGEVTRGASEGAKRLTRKETRQQTLCAVLREGGGGAGPLLGAGCRVFRHSSRTNPTTLEKNVPALPLSVSISVSLSLSLYSSLRLVSTSFSTGQSFTSFCWFTLPPPFQVPRRRRHLVQCRVTRDDMRRIGLDAMTLLQRLIPCDSCFRVPATVQVCVLP